MKKQLNKKYKQIQWFFSHLNKIIFIYDHGLAIKIVCLKNNDFKRTYKKILLIQDKISFRALIFYGCTVKDFNATSCLQQINKKNELNYY